MQEYTIKSKYSEAGLQLFYIIDKEGLYFNRKCYNNGFSTSSLYTVMFSSIDEAEKSLENYLKSLEPDKIEKVFTL